MNYPNIAKFACFSLALSTAALAAVSVGERNVQVGGFFSQGYIDTDGNNYPFDIDGGTADFREAAINVSTTVGARLRVGAQAFAQRLGNYGDDKVKLDWAVADYNVRQEFGVRVGRVKYPKGLYGEALDLDVIRPFVFLPAALYNPVVRDFNSSFNGGMVYGTINAGKGGSFDYKAFYGDIPMNPEQGVADFFNTTSLYAAPGVSELGMDSTFGAHLVWNTPVNGLKFCASFSALDSLYANGKFAAYPVANVQLTTDRYDYLTLSAEYAVGLWTLATEWQRVGGEFIVGTPFGNSLSDSKVLNWYASVARRLNDRWEVGTYYSSQENDNAAASSPRKANYNRDWALSVRFDVNEHVTLKLEGHSVDGTYNLFNTARTPNRTLKDRTTLVAVKTTLVF